MTIPNKLKDEIWDYCRVNSITNIDDFTLKLIRQGFTVEKFGATPTDGTIKEKIVEVPVEKIVEKVVHISDDAEINKLAKEVERLEKLNEILRMDSENSLAEAKEYFNKVKELEKALEAEKNKKKRDIYGE